MLLTTTRTRLSLTDKPWWTISLAAVSAPAAGLAAVAASDVKEITGLLYFCLFVLAVALMWRSAKFFGSKVNPASAFFAAWSLQFGLLALPLFDYVERPELQDVAYIALALSAAAAGFKLGSRFRRAPAHTTIAAVHSDQSRPSMKGRLLSWAIVIGVLGIIGQLAELYDASIVTGLSLDDRMGDPSLVRQLHFENLQESRVGPLAPVEHLLGPLSYLALPMILAIEPRIRKQPAIAIIVMACSFIMISLNSLFSQGGRIGIVLAIALITLSIVLFRDHPIRVGITWKRLILLTLLGVLGWYFGTSFLADRNLAKPDYIQARLGTELQPLAQAAVEGDDSIGYFLVTVNYFASPTPTLLRFLHLPDEALPGPYFGHYSFNTATQPVINRVARDSVPTFFEMRADIFSILTEYGFAGNVWATGLRDLIVDFGRGGAVVALFLLAFTASAIFASAQRLGSQVATKVLAFFATVASFWFPFHMLTFVGFFFLPMAYLIMMLVIRGQGRDTRALASSPALSRRTHTVA